MTSTDTAADAGLRNWAGNLQYSARAVHRPTSVEQLQELVAASERIHAVGSRHSFSTVADTTGDLVSTADVVPGIRFDESAGEATPVVTIGAGTPYAEIVGALHERGLALPNLGSLPHITVGGAAATGTHGSGARNQCLATSVVAIDYVRADGSTDTVRAGDPAFGGSVLALGALGVATALHVQTVESFDIRQDVWLDAPLDTVCAELDAIMDSAYSVSLFSTGHRPGTVDQLWFKSRTGSEVPDASVWGAHPAPGPMHPIAGEDTRAVTEQGGRPGPWHARLPHFRAEFKPSAGDEQQSEFFVRRQHGPDALAAIHGLQLGDVVQVMEIRAVAGDDLWLGPANRGDSLALHFTWRNDTPAVHRALGRVEAALAPYDPRPHWGKVFTLPADTVRAAYPELDRFRALAATVDPDRVFANDYLDTYVY